MQAHDLVRLRNEPRLRVAIPWPNLEDQAPVSALVLRLQHDRPAIPKLVQDADRVRYVLPGLDHELELSTRVGQRQVAPERRHLRLHDVPLEGLGARSLGRHRPEIDPLEELLDDARAARLDRDPISRSLELADQPEEPRGGCYYGLPARETDPPRRRIREHPISNLLGTHLDVLAHAGVRERLGLIAPDAAEDATVKPHENGAFP